MRAGATLQFVEDLPARPGTWSEWPEEAAAVWVMGQSRSGQRGERLKEGGLDPGELAGDPHQVGGHASPVQPGAQRLRGDLVAELPAESVGVGDAPLRAVQADLEGIGAGDVDRVSAEVEGGLVEQVPGNRALGGRNP